MTLLSEISDYVLENGELRVNIQYEYGIKFHMNFINYSNSPDKKISNDLIKIIGNYGKFIGLTYIEFFVDEFQIEQKEIINFELYDKTIQEMVFNLNISEVIGLLSIIFNEKEKELSQIYPELSIFVLGTRITIYNR